MPKEWIFVRESTFFVVKNVQENRSKKFKKSSKKVEKVVDFTFGRDYNPNQPKRKRVEFRSKITALIE